MENEEKETVEEVSKEDSVEKTEVKEEKKPENSGKKSSVGIVLCFVIIAFLVIAIVCLVLAKREDSGGETTKTSNEKQNYYSEYRLSGNSLEDFDLAFLKLEENTKNKVYSPLSIKYALEMLAEGAEGDSREQLDAVIGDYKSRKYPNNEHMSFANAMFIRNSFKDNVLPEYVDNLQNRYGAEVFYDDFVTPNTMNDWISSRTFKLLNNIIDQETVDKTYFFLINALAIDMNWVNLIQCAPTPANLPCIHYGVHYTHEKYSDYVSEIYDNNGYPSMNFNGKDNIKSVIIGGSFNNYDIVKDLGEENIRKTVGDEYNKFLAGGGCGNDPDTETYLNSYIDEINSNYHQEKASSDFYLYVDDDVKMFAKDLREYDGMTLQYVGIMPQKVSLNEFIKNANAETIRNYISSLKELKYSSFKEGVITRITGNIPLFNYDYDLNLEEDLKALGIKDIFDKDKIDLSAMLKDDSSIETIEAAHKAMIEFSNEGIKAAAVSFLGGAGSTGCKFDYEYEVPVEVIDLSFDKPYMYVIRDKDSGEVWFVGSVFEPTTK